MYGAAHFGPLLAHSECGGRQVRRRGSRFIEVLVLGALGAVSVFAEPHSTRQSTSYKQDNATYAANPEGVDIKVYYPTPFGLTTAGECQATMVYRRELAKNQCEMAFATAGHCVHFNGSFFHTIAFEIPQSNGKTRSVRVENGPGRLAAIHSLQDLRDAAVFRFTENCSLFGQMRPARLAATKADESVQLVVGDALSIKKHRERLRDPKSVANWGGGAWVPFRLKQTASGEMWCTNCIAKGTMPIQQGDSGGPIKDSHGRLVGMTAQTHKGQDGRFDPRGVGWVKRQLSAWGLDTEPETQRATPPPSLASSARSVRISDGKIVWQPTPEKEIAVYLRKNQDGTRRVVDANGETLPPEAHSALEAFYAPYLPRAEKFFGEKAPVVMSFMVAKSMEKKEPVLKSLAAISSPLSEKESSHAALTPTQPQQLVVPRQPPSRAVASSDPVKEYEELQYEVTQVDSQGRRYLKKIGRRERYHACDTGSQKEFADVPIGGTGKIIVAYFGPRRQNLHDAAAGNPWVEVRNYPVGSLEHCEAKLFDVQTLALDGLGRKISRWPMDPAQVLNEMLTDQNGELSKLRRYLAAKKTHASPQRALAAQAQGSKHPLIGALEKCASCHAGEPGLSSDLKSVNSLAQHVPVMSSSSLQRMLDRANLTPQELSALKSFVTEKTSSHAPVQPRQVSTPRVSLNRIPACFMTEAERETRIASLPEFAPGSAIGTQVVQAAEARRIAFFDQNSVPKTWQGFTFSPSAPHELKTERNETNSRSMRDYGYHGDGGAREFPWNKSAGTDAASNVTTEKFVIPPARGAAAQLVSRTVQNSPNYFNQSPNMWYPQLGWQYNAGATLGEVLKIQDPQSGEAIPFEIRVRTKLSNGAWGMDVLRPFESPQDLAAAVERLCAQENRPKGCGAVSDRVVASIQNPTPQVLSRAAFVNKGTFGTRRDPLTLSSTAKTALTPTASVQALPDLPPDVVRRLLKETPFKSVFGKPWLEAKGSTPAGWAPTSNSNFNIVPKNYFGAFIPMNQKSCMNCHDSAGRHVNYFDPDSSQMFAPIAGDIQRPRSWYNYMAGNDTINSLHPFTKQSVQRGAPADTNAVDPCLVKAQIFQ